MRRICLTLLMALLTPAAAAHAQQNDTTAVLATLDRFTAALRIKDSTGMKAELHENAGITLLRGAPGNVRVVALDGPGFIKAATQGPALDEPIRNPKVTIDADLATVWAEYQVRINGAVSHCGYDAFHLVRVAGAWKILHVSDTARQQGCGAMW